MVQYCAVGPMSPFIDVVKYWSYSCICCWKIGLVSRKWICILVPVEWWRRSHQWHLYIQEQDLEGSFHTILFPWRVQEYRESGYIDCNIFLKWNPSMILQQVFQTLSADTPCHSCLCTCQWPRRMSSPYGHFQAWQGAYRTKVHPEPWEPQLQSWPKLLTTL